MSSSETELRPLDRRIWQGCAGSSVRIPPVNSTVYYFPQGHMEQSSSPHVVHHFSLHVLSKPCIPCFVSSVAYHADPVTDEVFVKVGLVPVNRSQDFHSGVSESQSVGVDGFQVDRFGEAGEEEAEEDKIVTFGKVLTPSDANNGGGFSVPRFCADLIFPPLDFEADPPVQTLSITDVHGRVWDFRHIYRGTPRRHLLTTGWSKYVNHKKLVAGDSVIFMKNSRGDVFSGIRRAVRSCSSGEKARWEMQINAGGPAEVEGGSRAPGVFSRNGRGRVPMETVVEAAELAAQDMPFEVVYYPKAGWSEFVVRAEVVENAMNVSWSAGMRVKMAMETSDSSRMTWFQGTVSAASVLGSGPWQGSPWRMLQVAWDEPEALQNAKSVNPWQVEYVASGPPLEIALPPAKKVRVPQNSGMLTDGEGEVFFPPTGLNISTMERLNPSLFSYNTFPAGMQGARQISYSVPSFSDITSQDTPQIGIENLSAINNMVPKLDTISTELNIGSSNSDNLSPNSQSSIHSFGTELDGNRVCSLTKAGANSFLLFGKVIYMDQPDKGSSEDEGSAEDDGSNAYNETRGM